jgi:glycerol-3-phosphate O-acyltransferase
VLLSHRGRALTLEEIHRELDEYLSLAIARRLPIAPSARLADAEAVRRILEALAGHNVVSIHRGGLKTVYSIGPDQYLAAAFYRNTIIHFFVNDAIIELALLKAVESDGDREAAFMQEALRLRDLLKFEFFFKEKSVFRASIERELKLQAPNWTQALAAGEEQVHALIRTLRPITSPGVLRSFFEAYVVAADTLNAADHTVPLDDKKFLSACGDVGRQYMLQRKLQSAESVSRHLFQTGLQLARNQKLLEAGDNIAERRAAFAAMLRDVLQRIDTIELQAWSRRRERGHPGSAPSLPSQTQ